jgi:ABC-type ATPase involved in cell division
MANAPRHGTQGGPKLSERDLCDYHRRVIWLEGVNCQRAGAVVLDGVTLGVAGGEMVIVQGRAGAGKSTLLAVAAARLAPEAGAVWLAERNIATLQRSSLPYVRRNIGYLPQKTVLATRETVLENLMLPLAVRGETVVAARDKAREALTLVGDTTWEDRPTGSLSAGQQRLVVLARALVGAPPLVVLDEPALGLGGDDLALALQATVWARNQGCAVLCGTADPTFAEALVEEGGRMIRLEDGRIVGAPPIGLVPFSATPKSDEEPDREEMARPTDRLSAAEEPS